MKMKKVKLGGRISSVMQANNGMHDHFYVP